MVDSKTVAFRCDASKAIGSGHVMRCLTLANMFRQNGWQCSFIVSEETPETVPDLSSSGHIILSVDDDITQHDIAIIDHYGLDQKYEAQVRSWAANVVAIDDLADRPHDCDLLIDQTYKRLASDYSALIPKDAEVLTGSEYALLRSDFADMRNSSLQRRTGEINRILVSFGATDMGNLLTKTIDAFLSFNDTSFVIDFIIGNAVEPDESLQAKLDLLKNSNHDVTLYRHAQNMAKLMSKADLAIGAGGTTSWERCCLGLPAIIVTIADNQKLVANNLTKDGAIFNLGWWEDITTDDLISGISQLHGNPKLVREISQSASQICNGDGALKIYQKISSLPQSASIILTPTSEKDADILFEWQTHPKTRKYFYNPEPPTYEEHCRWLDEKINDSAHKLYIVEQDGTKCGFLRLEQMKTDENDYQISILVAPDFYGQGIATATLMNIHGTLKDAVFHAFVLEENKASRALFAKAGYIKAEKDHYIYKGSNA